MKPQSTPLVQFSEGDQRQVIEHGITNAAIVEQIDDLGVDSGRIRIILRHGFDGCGESVGRVLGG